MKKMILLFASMTTLATAFAQPDYNSISSKLYPNKGEDSAFTAKFFEIVEAHKTKDPLLEGKGPAISEYSIDKIKFAFITNENDRTVDLVFFNWNLAVFSGLEELQELSTLYGKSVYVLKNVDKKSISSQGENHDQLSNFSYLLGANYMEKQIKIGAPEDFQVPQAFIDWKPHAEYMDRSHPLRQTLDANTLVILSPSKEIFFKQSGLPENMRSFFEQSLTSQGGFYNTVMGMMVHEMFHVKEGEDQVNRLASSRRIDENRKAIIELLQSEPELRELFATYIRIVFSIGDSLKSDLRATELAQLSDLKRVISEIKTKYSESWKFIWNYEYTEGFAEYVSAYSMVQVGITSLDAQIDLQKSDKSNNFAYRTGAIGGLYLANRQKTMPFENKEDHSESLWENILRLSNTSVAETELSRIKSKYAAVDGVDAENEIDRVIKYLISTIEDAPKQN